MIQALEEVIERNRNLVDEEPVPLKPACVDQASNNTNNTK